MARDRCTLDYKVVTCKGYKAKPGRKLSIYLPGPCTNRYNYALVKQYGFTSVDVYWDQIEEARAAGWSNKDLYISIKCNELDMRWGQGTVRDYLQNVVLREGSIAGFDAGELSVAVANDDCTEDDIKYRFINYLRNTLGQKVFAQGYYIGQDYTPWPINILTSNTFAPWTDYVDGFSYSRFQSDFKGNQSADWIKFKMQYRDKAKAPWINLTCSPGDHSYTCDPEEWLDLLKVASIFGEVWVYGDDMSGREIKRPEDCLIFLERLKKFCEAAVQTGWLEPTDCETNVKSKYCIYRNSYLCDTDNPDHWSYVPIYQRNPEMVSAGSVVADRRFIFEK